MVKKDFISRLFVLDALESHSAVKRKNHHCNEQFHSLLLLFLICLHLFSAPASICTPREWEGSLYNTWNTVPASKQALQALHFLSPSTEECEAICCWLCFVPTPATASALARPAALTHFLTGTNNTNPTGGRWTVPPPPSYRGFIVGKVFSNFLCSRKTMAVLAGNLISTAPMSLFSVDYKGHFYHSSCRNQQHNSLEYSTSINISLEHANPYKLFIRLLPNSSEAHCTSNAL